MKKHSATGWRLGSIPLWCRQMLCAGGRGATWTSLVKTTHPHRRMWAHGDATTVGADGPCARDAPLARLEAVLLLCQQPQASRKLAELADLADGTKTRTLVRKLNQLYDVQGSAFRVEEVAGGFQLRTRSDFAPWLQRLHSAPVAVRLSPPAMETLAVVAYRQPVLRAEVEAIRGVQCGEILRQLIERDLVKIVGRSEELGRPFLYGTGKRFLQVFGLRHLDELPRADLFRSAGLDQHPPCSQQPASQQTDQQTTNENLISHKDEEESEVNALPSVDPSLEELPKQEALATGEPPLDQRPEADLDNDDDHEDEEEDEEFDDEEEDFDDEDEDDDEDFDDEDEEDEEFDDEDDYDEEFDDEDEEDIENDIEDEPWEEVEDDEEEEEEEEEEDWDDEDWDDEEADDDEDE